MTGRVDPAPPCHDAAAYVLGALPASERAGFEEHLTTCAECQSTVRELVGLPGLLGRISAQDLDVPPLPEMLVPALLAGVRRRSQRRRRVIATLAAAAAVVAVLGGMAVLSGLPVLHPHDNAATMSQVVASPVHATAALEDDHHGTRISLDCTYAGKRGSAAPEDYALVVVDVAGTSHPVASWRIGPGGETRVTGTVDVPRQRIARVEIRTAQGTPLLRLAP